MRLALAAFGTTFAIVLPRREKVPINGQDLKEYLTDLERSLIQQALDDAQGVVARAAEKLHIRRTTLVEKMRKYKINNKREAVN